MNFIRKIQTFLILLAKGDFKNIVSILSYNYKVSFLSSAKSKWEWGKNHELTYWDIDLAKSGDNYDYRLDINYNLQTRPALLLPNNKFIDILDVGAGPLTTLGKRYNDKSLNIIAVDPLADGYNVILDKYNITPIVKTKNIAAEEISDYFPNNSFDLIFARNCIDHSYDPEKALLQMIDTVKKNHYVLLEHRINEGKNENYIGLHQWNFNISMENNFIISSKYKSLNFSKKYKDICSVECEIIHGRKFVNDFVEGYDRDEGDWLITRIHKI